eukprot:jgi/Phyca11/13118/fgenesh1_pg.PHYCAscaffold_2_\
MFNQVQTKTRMTIEQLTAIRNSLREHSQSIVKESVLAKIDSRIVEFERINALIQGRAKLVLDVEYAKRTLQTAQLECEKATRFITDQLKCLSPNLATDVLKLYQEYTQQAEAAFQAHGDMIDTAIKP